MSAQAPPGGPAAGPDWRCSAAGRLGGLALGQLDELMEVPGGLQGGAAGDGDKDDRGNQQEQSQPGRRGEQRGDAARHLASPVPVSYTHLTLPTILRV